MIPILAGANGRRLVLFIFAVVIAGFAAFLVTAYLKRMEAAMAEKYADRSPKIDVLVPRTDLPEGERVEIEYLAVRTVREDTSPADAIRPHEVERAEGQTLKVAVQRGRPLLWSYLSSGAVPSFSDMLSGNQRALTIPVDELNSISGMVRPNDRIDLFFIDNSITIPGAPMGPGNEKVVVPLMQNVLVKATGTIVRRERSADGKEYDRNYSTLTLDLDPEDIGRVLLAQEAGTVRAALKRTDQKNTTAYKVTTGIDLRGTSFALGKEEEIHDPFGVSYYIGGRGGGVITPVKQQLQQEFRREIEKKKAEAGLASLDMNAVMKAAAGATPEEDAAMLKAMPESIRNAIASQDMDALKKAYAGITAEEAAAMTKALPDRFRNALFNQVFQELESQASADSKP